MTGMTGKLKIYKKGCGYSYTIGASPTIELLRHMPGVVKEIYIHSKFDNPAVVVNLCRWVPVLRDDRTFLRVGVNDNSYVLGVFEQYDMRLDPRRPHIVLVNPSDMGNLGTIIRTVLGFGYYNLAIITPAADMWNPKTVRASMGAFFKLNISCYDGFDRYRASFPDHRLFPFMLNGAARLSFEDCPETGLFSLIFGNESSGLDDSFLGVGQPVFIPQTDLVDSLNLAAAVSVGAYTFSLKNKLI
ncbi:MAG: TrmH family RNA methyltransferase [Eubacteriales bacterium]|jgi:TrmH family RNA methyltransferase|nr:TrmH family RNA methyltransferase [Eubacteriales bacterium]